MRFEKLPAHNCFSVFGEDCLTQGLSQEVSWLLLRFDVMDRYVTPFHIIIEVEQSIVNMLRAWSCLWELGDFDCARIILKDLAVNLGVIVVDVKPVSFGFL